MALHTLFITNRAGGLIYSKELSSGARLNGNEYLLLASTFHSLHAISKQLAPVPSGGLQSVEAPAFTMHCMESPTGVKFFVTARPGTKDVPAFLKRVYALYSDFVLKNPFYEVDMPIRLKVRRLGRGKGAARSAAPPFTPCPSQTARALHPPTAPTACSSSTRRWKSTLRRGGWSLSRPQPLRQCSRAAAGKQNRDCAKYDCAKYT